MNDNQIIYVLTNPAMPGLLKIGRTTQDSVESRMQQLYTTGVPLPFECIYAVTVENCVQVESVLHNTFEPFRINPNREFFKIQEENVLPLLEYIGIENITPIINKSLNQGVSNQEIESKQKYKRPKMDFFEMDIPQGSELIFKDGSTKVTICNSKKVNFNGEEISLTPLTRKLLNSDNLTRPAPFWTYKGKKLIDIYDETYNSNEN